MQRLLDDAVDAGFILVREIVGDELGCHAHIHGSALGNFSACHFRAGTKPRSSNMEGLRSSAIFRTTRMVPSTKLFDRFHLARLSDPWIWSRGRPTDFAARSERLKATGPPHRAILSKAPAVRSPGPGPDRAERPFSSVRASATSSYRACTCASSFKIRYMLRAANPNPRANAATRVMTRRSLNFRRRPTTWLFPAFNCCSLRLAI